MQMTTVRKALRHLRQTQARNYFNLWLLRDVERGLPHPELHDELEAAGLTEVLDALDALASALVRARRAILAREN